MTVWQVGAYRLVWVVVCIVVWACIEASVCIEVCIVASAYTVVWVWVCKRVSYACNLVVACRKVCAFCILAWV